MNSTCSWLIRPSLNVKRTGGVDAQHGDTPKLDERAQGLVDEAPVTGQRRQEAPQHVVQRHVMVARHPEHFVTAVAQPLEEGARIAELLGPRALGEVAADHDEVGLELVDAVLDPFDQPRVMGAEMQVRKMDEASHAGPTHPSGVGSALLVIASKAKQSSARRWIAAAALRPRNDV